MQVITKHKNETNKSWYTIPQAYNNIERICCMLLYVVYQHTINMLVYNTTDLYTKIYIVKNAKDKGRKLKKM